MKRLFTIAAILMMALSSYAQINPMEPLQRDPAIKYGKLSNGMTYYIMHNDRPAERAEYYLLTNVGAIQESETQRGLAHFLEHMCLNGTKNLPGKMLIDYFQSIGASFGGNINASTGVEVTEYMLNNIPTTRQGIIDTALMVMHDYAGFVTNDPKEIENERGVIIEEWRTRRTADWRVFEQSMKYLYKGSKYENCNIIGTKEGLETFPAEELVKFYETWYRPDLQAVVVVGDVDPEKIYNQLEELFKDIPVQNDLQPKEEYKIPDNEEPMVGIVTDPELQSTMIDLYVKSEPLPKEQQGTGIGLLNDLVEAIVGLVMNERYADIYTKPDAPFFQVQAGFTNLTNTLDAFAVTTICEDGKAETAFEAALKEVERAKRYGFTEAEYNRAVNNILQMLETRSNNKSNRQNSEIVELISQDFFDNDIASDPTYLFEMAKAYLEMMSVDLVNQAFSSMDYSANSVVIYAGPDKKGLQHPTEDDIKGIVTLMPSAEVENLTGEDIATELLDASALKGSKVAMEAVGKFESTVWTLENGIKVVVRPSDLKKDEVLLTVSVDGGKSMFSEQEIASLDDNFLSFIEMAGVSEFSAPVLSKMLAGKTAAVSPFISELTYGIEGSCAPKDLETMFQLAYLYCVSPRFEQSEFEPLMSQIQALLPNLVNTPAYKLAYEFYKVAYNSPRKAQISMETLTLFDFETMVRCYKELFGNMAGATVYVTGNVNLDELKPIVEKYIGSLPISKYINTIVDNNIEVLPGRIVDNFRAEMETPKTTVVLAYSGDMPYSVENNYYMDALTYILDLIYVGTIREEEGASYGVGVSGSISLRPKQQAVVMIQFDTDPAKADRMIALAKQGIEDITDKGVDPDYLEKAKKNFLKNIPEQKITNAFWTTALLMDTKFGIDQVTGAEAVIESMTAEKLQQFVKDILSQGNIVSVVMNPAE